VEEIVFETEERSRADDGGFREDRADDFFGASFCTKEFGWGVFIGIVGGDVDESVHVVFGYCFGYSFGAFDVDVFEGEVPK
jgi:hypothetical protein